MRERVGRALGDQPVAAAVRKKPCNRRSRNIPDTEPLAHAALDKLRANGTPTSEELQALELAFPGFMGQLPLAASHLGFTSPWTLWRAAVKPPGA